jgi:hypothetical protein
MWTLDFGLEMMKPLTFAVGLAFVLAVVQQMLHAMRFQKRPLIQVLWSHSGIHLLLAFVGGKATQANYETWQQNFLFFYILDTSRREKGGLFNASLKTWKI